MLLAVVVATGCGRADERPADSAADRSVVRSVDRGPRIEVNLAGLRGEITPGSMQKWADDVSAGDVPTVTAKCWTIAPEYIAERYFADRGILASIFTQVPVSGQAGVAWGRYGGAYGHVPWEEAKSGYPCPRVTLHAGQPQYSDAYVAHIARRFIRRAQGHPINPADTDAAYPLVCAFGRGSITGVGRGNPDDVAVTREALPHGDTRWTVRAGLLTMQMAVKLGGVCVREAS